MPTFRLSAIAMALIVSGAVHADSSSAKPASEITRTLNQSWLQRLPFEDQSSFEDARRGLIAPFTGVVENAKGQVVWDRLAYNFLDGNDAPASVNPSLWRMGQLNNMAGLFEVRERIYQIRGMDLSNMTIIEGESGLILIDPSYEVKADYGAIPRQIGLIARKWNVGVIALWYPILTDARHAPMLTALMTAHPDALRSEASFPPARAGHSMVGSGLWVLNPPFGLDEEARRIEDIFRRNA